MNTSEITGMKTPENMIIIVGSTVVALLDIKFCVANKTVNETPMTAVAMISFFIAVPGISPSTIGVAPGATLGQGAGLPSQQLASQLTGILLTGSIFQSWFMGIVAGKMGEGSVADG